MISMNYDKLRDEIPHYVEALEIQDFSPLTINSYISAANRFIDYLEEGKLRKEE